MKIAGYEITAGPGPFGIAIASPAQVRRNEAARVDANRRQELMQLQTFYTNSSWKVAGGDYAAIGNHPVLNLWNRTYGYGVAHQTQMELFHVLRLMIPTIGAAINKRRQLEGAVYVDSKDTGLKRLLQEFVEYVPVGPVEGGSARGLNAYLDGLCVAADEFGMGVGEAMFDEAGRNLEYLLLADMRTFSLRDIHPTVPREYRLIQMQDGIERDIASAMVDRIAFRYDGTNPWPLPMVFGLELLSEIIVRMFTSVNNLWMRVGDPSYVHQIVYDKEARVQNTVNTTGPDGSAQQVDAQLYNLQIALQQINQAKSYGLAGDVNLSFVGGEYKSSPLMDHPATASIAPYLDKHYPMIVGEIIDASDVPHFLFFNGQGKAEGLSQGRSQAQAAIAAAAAKQRQIVKGRIGRRMLDTYLLSIGAAQFVGRYEMYFDDVSIIDRKLEAEASNIEADAASKWLQVAMELFRPETDDETGNAVITPEMMKFLEDKGVL